ncbi:MAG TPA: SprT family zinc-dependent metalloprotease [Candidatus Omnitrophota bacterium]|nr:SprT family zinc-dependent metalloprotease [Candidatus Omnitrophota bacterium]
MSTTLTLDLGGHSVTIALKRSALARRLSLRIDPAVGPVMVLPQRTSLREAEKFALANRVWLAERLARLPGRVAFEPGAVVPLLGAGHAIHHEPGARRGVWLEDGAIKVSGQPDFVARRVGDFLKAEAKRLILPRAHELADRIGRKPGRISVKDTRSRWGSCSAKGDLAFSWRLVLAPERILTYVVAHEVAHLAELNHSPAFWAVVATLTPDHAHARAWLKSHGARLHRYG